jgi:hypothetical protein
MIDILRLHVLWAAGSTEGERIAEMISRHFDGIGMERDGVAYRVPVRFSSAPWAPGSPLPKPIDLGLAKHNAVILLHDDEMYEHSRDWDTYVAELRQRINGRANVDVYVAFGSPNGESPLPSDAASHTQYTRRKKWQLLVSDEARDKRLLLHLLIRVRTHLRTLSGATQREPIFVSHAKADGDTTAKAIVDFVNDSSGGVPLETFYDATELMPGENYEERFSEEIGCGTLLAIVSDVYDSRPWCVFELTEAKRRRRPIVLADIGGGRTSRTYPYGANLPRVRVDAASDRTDWIEPLLVEALSEGLRCDLFEVQASTASPHDTLILPRPPELFDIVHRDALPSTILYPDPPLGDVETQLLQRILDRMSPTTKLVTLGELA